MHLDYFCIKAEVITDSFWKWWLGHYETGEHDENIGVSYWQRYVRGPRSSGSGELLNHSQCSSLSGASLVAVFWHQQMLALWRFCSTLRFYWSLQSLMDCEKKFVKFWQDFAVNSCDEKTFSILLLCTCFDFAVRQLWNYSLLSVHLYTFSNGQFIEL